MPCILLRKVVAEAYIVVLWTYILGLVKAGVEDLQDRPRAPGPMDHRQMTMCTCLGCYDELSLRSESIHYQPPEGPRACHPNRS